MTTLNRKPIIIAASAVVGLIVGMALVKVRASNETAPVAPDQAGDTDVEPGLEPPAALPTAGSLASVESDSAAGDSEATFAALEPITVEEVLPFWPELSGKVLEGPTAHTDVPRVQGYSCYSDETPEQVMDSVQAALEKAGWQDLSRHGAADEKDRYGLQLAGKRAGYLTLVSLRRMPMGPGKVPLMFSLTVFKNSQVDRGISGAFTLPIPRALAFKCIDRVPPSPQARAATNDRNGP